MKVDNLQGKINQIRNKIKDVAINDLKSILRITGETDMKYYDMAYMK